MVERERFVPRSVGNLTDQLCDLPWADAADQPRFRSFVRLVAALYHYEFHDREQRVLASWQAVGDSPDAGNDVTAELTALLDGANYTPVSIQELTEAFEQESLIPLRLEVDLEDYDEVLIYRRGSHTDTVDVPKWRGLRSEQRSMTIDERVVVHTRVKPKAWFEERDIDPTERNLQPGHSSLKLFQNVPRADIEMLLPSAQVRFRPIDSVMVGVPAIASGVAVLVTKLLPTLGLLFLLFGALLGLRDEQPELDQTSLALLFGGAITLGGFLFRQWTKLKNRRVQYLKTLSENLYFRTVGDGPGVFHSLLAAAEEQEVIEVILATRFLLAEPDGVHETELDRRIETWLADSDDRQVDFEVDDAVAKLRRLGIVADSGGTGSPLHARPLADVLVTLDRRWDDLFEFPAHQDGVVSGVAPDLAGSPPGGLVRLRRVVDRFRGEITERVSQRES